MRNVVACAAILLTIGFSASANAAELQSGLQPGARPGAFYVQDVSGPSAGKSLCYRCKYGARPVVTIFTRKMTPEVTQLVKQIDGVVGENSSKKMAAFVVLLTDKPGSVESELKQVAEKSGLKNVPLTVFEDEVGPPSYQVSKKADLTVMMWVESNVKVNHAYASAKIDNAEIQKIVADTQKILN